MKKSILIGKTKSISKNHKIIKISKSAEKYRQQEKLILALEQVSKVLVVEVKIQKILEDMAEIIAKTLGAKWVNFWELTPDKKSLHISAMYGMKQEYVEHSKKEPVRLGTAWIGRAVKTGKPWVTNDILSDPNLLKDLGINWQKAIEQQDYRALLCIPTTSMRGPVGGMCIYYPEVHEFTDFEMRLATIAANQATTSITNAQIFEELVSERNKTFSVIQSLQDGLIMYDLENRISFFNPKAEELLYLRAEDVVGKKIEENLKKNDVYWQNLFNISNLTQTEYNIKEYTVQGNKKLVLQVSYVPVRDQQYKKIGSMQILHDITKEKEVELLKSSFISTVSHQLRTPLSSIKWAVDTLIKERNGPISTEQKEMLKKIFNTNDYLIGLVANLLDISKINEGKFDYIFSQDNLENLVSKIFQSMKNSAKKRNIDFQLKIPSVPAPKISFDKTKLEIAIRNVIDNAIRYTPPKGSVKVEIRVEKYSLFLIVEDTGIGIPAEYQGLIFAKFFRAKNAIKFQTEGSGLGLFIAKNIVEKHNALMSFESNEGKGTTFMLQFPLEPKKMPVGVIEGD